MPDHDIVTVGVDHSKPLEPRYVMCKCGEKFSAETEDEARRRHSLHHRAPEAAVGIEQARAALRKGNRGS